MMNIRFATAVSEMLPTPRRLNTFASYLLLNSLCVYEIIKIHNYVECDFTVFALGLSFAYGWQVTLVVLAFVPFMILGGFVQAKFEAGEEEKTTVEENEAGNYCVINRTLRN